MNRLIVCIATAEALHYVNHSAPWLLQYAAKCAAELRFLTRSPDQPAWYKVDCLQQFANGELGNYQQLLLIDADLVVMPDAPNIFERKAGLWMQQDLFATTLYPNIFQEFASKAVQLTGQKPAADQYFNTGVILIDVQQAILLASALQSTPKKEELISFDHAEQGFLNLAIRRSGLTVQALGPEWNLPCPSYFGWVLPENHWVAHVNITADWKAKEIHLADHHRLAEQRRVKATGGLPALLQNVGSRYCLCRVFRTLGYTRGVEVGVQEGIFSNFLLQHWPGTLIGVDPYCFQEKGYDADEANVSTEKHEQIMHQAIQRLSQHKHRFRLLRQFSPAVARLFETDSLDFVYLDGNHTFEHVAQELTAWWPKIREGGMLCGHDYEGTRFGVQKAVDQFAAQLSRTVYSSGETTACSFMLIK